MHPRPKVALFFRKRDKGVGWGVGKYRLLGDELEPTPEVPNGSRISPRLKQGKMNSIVCSR